MSDSVGDIDPKQNLIKIYEIYLDDLGRTGNRHESARQYYITIIAALSAFLGLAGKDGLFTTLASSVGLAVGVIGIAVCALWFMHMLAFSQLFDQKLGIVRNIEQSGQFASRPFTEEHTARRLSTTFIDQCAAIIIGLLFAACLIFAIRTGPP